MKEDDEPEKLPTFGASLLADESKGAPEAALNPKSKDLDDEIAASLAKLNLKEDKSPMENNDSFSNLQVAGNAIEDEIAPVATEGDDKKKVDKETELKISMIQPAEADQSDFVNDKSSFMFSGDGTKTGLVFAT